MASTRGTADRVSTFLPLSSAWRHRFLVAQLVRREVLERYRGSILGLLWSFVHPLLMLLVYLFVFGVVFKMKWGVDRGDNVEFAVVLFSGLVIHALLAESLVRAPTLVLRNPHFVKKIVFPLEILSVASIGAALFHMLVGLIILVLIHIFVHNTLSWNVLFLPVVVAPLILLSLGVSWFVASLAVFIRDVAQIVGILATVLLFLCPIFYPLSAVPENLQPFMYANPLTLIVEQVRAVLIYGDPPAWSSLGIYGVISYLVMCLGYWWFNRTRRAFADVL